MSKKINNQESIKKKHFKENQKRPNALFYLSPQNDFFSSFKPKRLKTINTVGKIKSKIKGNITFRNSKYENNSNILRKTNFSKFHNNLNKTLSDNFISYFNQKNFSKHKNSLTYSKINKYIPIKKDKYSNNNNNISKNNTIAKHKVFNIVQNIKKTNKNVNLSLNNKDLYFSSKRTNIFEDGIVNSIKKKFSQMKYKRKNNNYSKSFLYTEKNNLISFNFYQTNKNIDEKEISNNLGKKYIYSKIEKNKNNRNYDDQLKININKINEIFEKKSKIIKKQNRNKNELNNNNTLEANKNKKMNMNNNTNTKNSISYNLKNKEQQNNNNINNNNNNIQLTKSINNNISNKPTVFSSYKTSEKKGKSIIVSDKDTLNKINNDKNSIKKFFLKENMILNLGSEFNEIETQEFESKFLNYELGVSDKSNLNYNLDSNNHRQNIQNINNEYEKSIEEIEKLAEQILNKSNYKDKNAYFNDILINYKKSKEFSIASDIEELKDGEKIQNVYVYISQKNK